MRDVRDIVYKIGEIVRVPYVAKLYGYRLGEVVRRLRSLPTVIPPDPEPEEPEEPDEDDGFIRFDEWSILQGGATIVKEGDDTVFYIDDIASAQDSLELMTVDNVNIPAGTYKVYLTVETNAVPLYVNVNVDLAIKWTKTMTAVGTYTLDSEFSILNGGALMVRIRLTQGTASSTQTTVKLKGFKIEALS